MDMPAPHIAITYCRLCNWMLRAAWMGQEILSTFAEEAGSVTLIPDDTGSSATVSHRPMISVMRTANRRSRVKCNQLKSLHSHGRWSFGALARPV
jgi:predicted Rdx family selenoprotein